MLGSRARVALTVTAAFERTLLGALTGRGGRARLMILMFHQVPREADPLIEDVPDARQFGRWMTWLRELCCVLPLADAAERLAAGTLPPRAACVTFDDGYEDNLSVAAPILARLGLPATFFIAADAVESGIMWNDLVIEGVRHCGPTLDLGGSGLGSFRLGGSAERRTAIERIIDQLKYRSPGERLELAEAVFRAAAGGDPPRLMMTRAQVAELSRLGFDIGAHTINHPILKSLADAEARAEIAESREWVQELTGLRPRSFAYPNGRPGVDYSPQHVRMVEEAGFEVAVSTAWGCALRASGRLELPRFAPWERDRRGFWLRFVKTAIASYA